MSDSNSDDIGGSDWDSGWFGEGGGGDNADDTNAWWGMGADWNLPDDSAAWGDMGYGWATPGAVWERVDITKDSPEATGYDVFKDAESGKLLTITPSGQYWINDPSTTAKPIKIWDSGALERASPGLGGFINQFAKSIFAKDGKPNVPGILGLTAFLNSGVGKKLLGTGEAPKVGYQGGIPKYEAVRERVSAPYDPNRRPGSGGQRYFSDTKYVDPTKTEELAAAKAAAAEQASGLAELNKANPAYEVKPKVEAKKEEPAAAPKGLAALPASAVASTLKVPQYDETGKVVEQERVGPVQDNTKMFDMIRPASPGAIPADLEEAVRNKPITAAGGGLVDAYQKYIGQPFANVAGPFARGLLGLEKPEYGEEQAYRTGQALSNMPGAGAPAGILKAATQAPEALKAAQMLPEMLGGLLGATVFHGSPYKFRKFDPTKIGSGEGAQSFGHGHYVAGEEDVAKFYRDKLSDKPEVKIGGETVGTQAQSPESVVAARLASTYSSMAIRGTPKTEDVVSVIEEGLDRTIKQVAKTGNFKLYQDLMDQKAALGRMKDQGIEFQSTGSLYKIDLPDEQIGKMLDWDKPVSQQSKEIQTALDKTGLMDLAKQHFDNLGIKNPRGKDIHDYFVYMGLKPADISNFLQQQGVTGIRYLDQGSRAAGKGTSNYVVFPGNEDLLKILERNNQPMAKGGLAGLKNLPAARTAKDEQGQVIAVQGGLMNLAKGRYLNGSTDGMADKIPANIEGKQPAALSHGEFVIPADVVSHLGNGNSEAGAKRLYSMMDKIRHARTGTTKQGKQINPNKYLPA
jgi:hypothetical protein